MDLRAIGAVLLLALLFVFIVLVVLGGLILAFAVGWIAYHLLLEYTPLPWPLAAVAAFAAAVWVAGAYFGLAQRARRGRRWA